MKADLLDTIRCPSCESSDLSVTIEERVGREVKEGTLTCSCGQNVPIRNYVPRFVCNDGYVDSFSLEWNLHRTTQLDSTTGRLESECRLAAALDFPLEELRGRVVFDAGCGTGRFAEVVLKYGGRVVAADLSYAVDAAFANMGRHERMPSSKPIYFGSPWHQASSI